MKKGMKLIALLIIVLPAVLGIILAGDAGMSAAAGTYQFTLTNDATGGDCTSIGTWDAGATVCHLTADLIITAPVGIKINSSGVELDGDGHKITGYAGAAAGIYINATDVTVRDTEISYFQSGIDGWNLSFATIEHNVISHVTTGIHSYSINDSHISYNDIEETDLYGIYMQYQSTGNDFSGNDFAGNSFNTRSHGIYGIALSHSLLFGNYFFNEQEAAIFIGEAKDNQIVSNYLYKGNYGLRLFHYSGEYWNDDNLILGNYFVDNSMTGLEIKTATWLSNSVINNNFINNGPTGGQLQAATTGPNVFYDSEPYSQFSGGNFWEMDGDSACPDADHNSYCDAPRSVWGGGLDNKAWSKLDEWGASITIEDSANAYWASYSDYLDRELTLDFTVRNEGKKTASNPRLMGGRNTEGVELLTPTPLLVCASLAPGATQAMRIKYSVPNGVTRYFAGLQFMATDEAYLLVMRGFGGMQHSENEP